MYEAKAVANFLLDLAAGEGVALTNMELLKHIYFAHGLHLASTNAPLISNRIEAWEYGPVIRSVYEEFKKFGSDPITARATKIDLSSGEILVAVEKFPIEIQDLIRFSFGYYSRYGAFELSRMTHEVDGPWDRVWNARDGKVRLNMEIPSEAIKAHFSQEWKSTIFQ